MIDLVGRFLVVLGGVVVVALFVALFAPMFIDWTGFRKNFEDQASRIIGKKVVVYGAVNARLLPFPSVTMHDVRVGQEQDGSPIVQVEQFSMDAELAPFLSGEALIFDMRVVNPKVKLRLLKDGTLDWTRGSQPEIPAKTVILENVRVTGGDIQFIDDQSGRTRLVTGLNAEMSAKSLAGPWRIEGDAALDGETGKFLISSNQLDDNGIIRMRTRLQPDKQPVTVDLDGELKLVDRKPNYQGTMSAQIERASTNKPKGSDKSQPPPRLKGKFELTNESIRIPDYRLEIGALDDPYVITGEATLDTGVKPQFLLKADGQQIDVNRIGNQGSNGKTSRDPSLSAKQRLNALIQIVSQIPVPQVPGKASVRLPAIVAGDTTIRDVQLDLEPAGSGWTIDNAFGTLPGRTLVEGNGQLALQGQPSFKGAITVASKQPTGLASWLSGEVDPAIRQLQQAGFSANVNLTHERQTFDDLEIAVGPATLKGRLDRQVVANQAPTLDVALAGDALDLDALRALTGLFTGQDAGNNVLDHRIRAQLKADKFTAFGVDAGDVETSFTIADGALGVEKLAVKNLAGAELTATGRAEGSLLDYKGSGEITFKAADPGPFFTMLKQKLPQHPVMDRLVRNAAWYTNTALRGAVTLGGEQGDGLSVTLAGVTNGSRVNLDYRMSDLLALTGKGTTSLEATLENNVTSVLFGQAGLDPLPVDADANGRMTLKVQAEGTDPADAVLTFATDRTSFTAGGKVDIRPQSFMNGQLALSLESADLDPYLVMNGVGVPQTGAGLPFKLTTTATIDGDKVAFGNIAGRAADNDFTGAMTLDRKAERTTASGELSLTKADATWLGDAVYGPMTDAASGNLSSAPLGIPVFKDIDVNLKLAAKQFWLGWPNPITDFTSNVAYKGDEISPERHEGRVGRRHRRWQCDLHQRGWNRLPADQACACRCRSRRCRVAAGRRFAGCLGQVRAGAVDGGIRQVDEGYRQLAHRLRRDASGRYQRARAQSRHAGAASVGHRSDARSIECRQGAPDRRDAAQQRRGEAAADDGAVQCDGRGAEGPERDGRDGPGEADGQRADRSAAGADQRIARYRPQSAERGAHRRGSVDTDRLFRRSRIAGPGGGCHRHYRLSLAARLRARAPAGREAAVERSRAAAAAPRSVACQVQRAAARKGRRHRGTAQGGRGAAEAAGGRTGRARQGGRGCAGAGASQGAGRSRREGQGGRGCQGRGRGGAQGAGTADHAAAELAELQHGARIARRAASAIVFCLAVSAFCCR